MQSVIAFILHHANRCTKHQEFYAIKDRILNAHGVKDGYDLQHIPGKRCYSCEGTGIHYSYDQYGIRNSDWCWHCIDGWYKRPMWILLQRYRFGKYLFHRPMKREYCVNNPFTWVTCVDVDQTCVVRDVIEGYIDHHQRRYSFLARWLLYLVYNRAMLKQEIVKAWHDAGWGWPTYWYYPRNWFSAFAHLVKRRGRSIPIQNIKAFNPFVRKSKEDLPY